MRTGSSPWLWSSRAEVIAPRLCHTLPAQEGRRPHWGSGPAHTSGARPGRPDPRTLSRRPAGRSGRTSAARELAVRDRVRTRGLRAQTLDLVLLVGLEVALEPEPVRVAFPSQDVSGHAVQEPAVVGGDHGAAREVQERVLQRAQGL